MQFLLRANGYLCVFWTQTARKTDRLRIVDFAVDEDTIGKVEALPVADYGLAISRMADVLKKGTASGLEMDSGAWMFIEKVAALLNCTVPVIVGMAMAHNNVAGHEVFQVAANYPYQAPQGTSGQTRWKVAGPWRSTYLKTPAQERPGTPRVACRL